MTRCAAVVIGGKASLLGLGLAIINTDHSSVTRHARGRNRLLVPRRTKSGRRQKTVRKILYYVPVGQNSWSKILAAHGSLAKISSTWSQVTPQTN